MELTLFGVVITPGLLALGVITGMTYGILAVGLVLVYRSTNVINFAHGEIGAFGAAVCGLLVMRWGIPYWLAFVAAIIVSAAAGAGTEMTVVRRLSKAPRLMTLVATLGVAQFLLFLSASVNNQGRTGASFPQPPGMPKFSVGAFLVTPAYSAMLFLTPPLVLVLALFLRNSRFGIGLRAAADNVDRARMVGISAGKMSTIAWALAGGVAAFTTVLIIPTRGLVTAELLGPVLLLRALAPAVVARLQSLPIALGAGIALGVMDQILTYNYPTSGVSEVMLFGGIVLVLLLQARRGGRQEPRQDWAAVQPWPPLPDALRTVPAIRYLGPALASAGMLLAVVVGVLATNTTAVTLVTIVAFALIGLSLGVVSGLGGQLSLGQFALAGVGATASILIVDRFDNYVLALLSAAVVTAAVSVVLGLPALRVKGLLLGVVTLSFALAAQRWLFSQPWALGRGVSPGRPSGGSVSFERTKHYYFWALIVFVIGFWLARNVWRGAVGLRLRAVRDNEDVARSFGISAVAVKLQGFAIGGAIAGLGGAVYGHLLARVSSQAFAVITSIDVVALAVLGGIGILTGPILGALYVIGVPRFLPLDNAGLAATSLGWLLLVLYFPGGIAQLVAAPRARLIEWLARRASAGDPESESDDAEQPAPVVGRLGRATGRRGPSPNEQRVLLEARGLVKRYGGIHAVGGVDLTVSSGEIVGLIGPNGAGKTTLFELISGFTRADEGTVTFDGKDVTRLSAERRARLGLIRSFQEAALFPTLTVLESVTLAFERVEPTNVALSVLGHDRPNRRKIERARQLVGLMGLGDYQNKQVRELSTGTRRITELACVAALEPELLLLDEPSSGIAQRESEALGALLVQMQHHLGCTLVVIDHDMPLLMGLSTRVVAMDSGTVIADGSPEDIRNDPLVVESYLGGDTVTIERSDRKSPAESPAVTRKATVL